MASRRFEVTFVGDTRQLESAFRRAGTQSATFANTLGRQYGTKGKIAGTALDGVRTATTRIGAAARTATPYLAAFATVGLAKAVSEAREASKAMAQTRAVVKSTGGVANVTAPQLERLAENLSAIVGQDDELIQQGGNLLLTFRNIRNEAGRNNDIFDQTLALTLDLAAAMKTDLTSAVKQVGKAMQDPAVGLTALRRSGVSFSEQQSEMISKLFESGKQLKAQKMILRELRLEFAGSAKANADSFDRLRVVFDNLAEDVGKTITPVLSRLADRISDIFSNKGLSNTEKFERLFALLGRLATKALDALIGILPQLVEHAASAGLKIAKALFEGIINAPIWAQFVAGGWLVSKLGGIGGMGGIGARLGTKFGTTFAAAAGPIIGAAIGSVLAGIKMGPKLADALQADIGGMDRLQATADYWDITLGKARKLTEYLRRHPGAGVPEALAYMEAARKSKLEPFKDAIEDLALTFADSLRSISRDSERNMQKIERSFGEHSQRAKRLLSANYDATIDAIRKAMDAGLISTERGNKRIQAILAKQLKLYGIKATEFWAGKPVRGENDQRGPGFSTHQRGAYIDKGRPSGDSVPAMLERGEYVLNRNAVSAVGKGTLDRINFGVAPRFQGGGIVALGKQLQGEGYEVGENPAFGGVTPGVHDPQGYHPTGQAIDVNDDSAPFASGSGEPGSLDRLYSRLKGMAGVVELLWRVAGHYDHLHVAMAQGASGALPGGGGRGGVPADAKIKLPRFDHKGFALSGIVAGGLNRASALTEQKANERLAQMKTRETGGIGIGISGGGSTAANARLGHQMMLAAGFGERQWPPYNELTIRESGWSETATNPTSGAYGIAQALPPSKYPPAGRPPASGPTAAKAQIGWMLNYIRERYGTPAGALAFHDANNWYRRGGIVGMDRGGEVIGRPLPKALQKWNKRFAPHWAPDWSGTKMPVNLIAMLAEFFGMPGVTMAQIAHGESGYRPGSAGVDKGGTKGYGLWAITTSFNDALVSRFGGYEEMWNPIKNAIVASKLWKARGLAPWYGTQYVTSSNAHWGGDFGELVRADGSTAGGGGKGSDKGDKPDVTAEFSGVEPQTLANLIGKRLAAKIRLYRSEAVRLGDYITDLEATHASPMSEGGEEIGDQERRVQIAFNKALLGNQEGLRDSLRKALGKGLPAKLSGKFAAELESLVGPTGMGGAILATRDKIYGLEHPEDADQDESLSERLRLIQEQNLELMRANAILRAQTPVFDRLFMRAPFGGVFHQGGVVPGPTGAPRTILAQGGETITPPGGAPVEVTLVVNDGAVNPSAIDVRVNDQLAQIVRTSTPRGGVIGRKATYS